MSLASTIESLDEVPEALREHYTPRGGKFVLDTDGDPRVVSARREAQEERKKRQELEARLKAYGDLKPEDVDALKTRRKRDDDDEETASQRMQRLRDELDRTKRDSDLSMREREAELARMKSELVLERIGTRIRSVAQTRVEPWAIEDAVLNGMRVFRQDEAGKIVAYDGEERLLSKSGDDLTMDEWLEGMRSSRPGWFGSGGGGTGNTGGGAQHQGGGNGQSRARPKQRSLMTPQEASQAITDMGMEAYLQLPQ